LFLVFSFLLFSCSKSDKVLARLVNTEPKTEKEIVYEAELRDLAVKNDFSPDLFIKFYRFMSNSSYSGIGSFKIQKDSMAYSIAKAFDSSIDPADPRLNATFILADISIYKLIDKDDGKAILLYLKETYKLSASQLASIGNILLDSKTSESESEVGITETVSTIDNEFESTFNQEVSGINLETYTGVTSQTPSGFTTRINFSFNNRIEMWDEEEWSDNPSKKNLKSGTYSISNTNGLDFIAISWSTGVQEKFLFLTNTELKDLYLYNTDSSPYFGRYDSAFLGSVIFGNDDWIKASSSLSETLSGRTVTYSPDKLGIRIGECWVPSKGVNEKLTLSINPRSQMVGENIYISLGFVSFSKPYLYSENSRIRKIRLSDSSGNSKIVELKDTPHFQPISVTGMGNAKDSTSILNMEILEVYSGSKYSDMCLNAICWKFSQ
jgi:hypothetical protein